MAARKLAFKPCLKKIGCCGEDLRKSAKTANPSKFNMFCYLSIEILKFHSKMKNIKVSLFILIYPYLSLFILIYPYLSLFILIYPYLSLFYTIGQATIENIIKGHSMSIQMGYDTIPLRFGSKSNKTLFLARLFQSPNLMVISNTVLEL